jgi:hypothetical protein
MFSEVLTSLVEVKAQLETDLLQQPEYRALLIFEKAAAQLAGAFAGRAGLNHAKPESTANACAVECAAGARARAPVDVAILEDCVRRALADVSGAADERVEAALLSPFELACEAEHPSPDDSSPAPDPAPAAEVELIEDAAPIPRFFLPVVGAPHRIDLGRH